MKYLAKYKYVNVLNLKTINKIFYDLSTTKYINTG